MCDTQSSGTTHHRAELQVTISCNVGSTILRSSPNRGCVLIVGDSSNNVVYKYRARYILILLYMFCVWCHFLNSNEAFCEGQLTRKMEVFRIRSSAELKFHWISLDYG